MFRNLYRKFLKWLDYHFGGFCPTKTEAENEQKDKMFSRKAEILKELKKNDGK